MISEKKEETRHEMMGKLVDLTRPEITAKQAIKSSVADSVYISVLRDLNLGIRPVKLVRRHIEDQRSRHLTIVD